jgi:hypothetical protein
VIVFGPLVLSSNVSECTDKLETVIVAGVLPPVMILFVSVSVIHPGELLMLRDLLTNVEIVKLVPLV